MLGMLLVALGPQPSSAQPLQKPAGVGASSGTAPPAREDACRPGVALPAPAQGMKLKFWSGFEDGVTVKHALNGRTSSLSGNDKGHDWSRLSHVFLYVSLAATWRGLVTTEIRSDRAHCGGRSLYMGHDIVDGDSQNRLQFFSSDQELGTEIFTRRWYYFPDFLKMLTAELDDTSVAGTREFGENGRQDYSIPLYVYRKSGKLAWRLAGVDYDNGKVWSSWTRAPKGFIVDNFRVPVPVERWFQLDIYLKRHATDGEVKVWVDGQVLFDVRGVRTKGPGSKWFTKIADYDGTKPGHLWVDDIEIYGR